MCPPTISHPDERTLKLTQRLLVCAVTVPAARLAWLAWHDGLGANPIEYLSRATGWWTLTALLVTLSITPARRVTGWHWLVRLRRTLGLCAFAYGLLHLVLYLWLDQFFDWDGIVRDVLQRPFVMAGLCAFLLMIPLAITSSNFMVRRLGGRRWQALHRLAYCVAVLGVVHYFWLVKKDVREPLVFGAILAVLLLTRLWGGVRRRTVPIESSAHSQVA